MYEAFVWTIHLIPFDSRGRLYKRRVKTWYASSFRRANETAARVMVEASERQPRREWIVRVIPYA